MSFLAFSNNALVEVEELLVGSELGAARQNFVQISSVSVELEAYTLLPGHVVRLIAHGRFFSVQC